MFTSIYQLWTFISLHNTINLGWPTFESWLSTWKTYVHWWQAQCHALLFSFPQILFWRNLNQNRIQTSFCKFQTPSLCVNSSNVVRHLGKIRHSKPHMLNRRFGLSLLYTDTKLSSQFSVVTDLGRRFFMSQNTARPRLTSCFMSLIRASLGQHFLLLYPTMFSLLGSGCSVR